MKPEEIRAIVQESAAMEQLVGTGYLYVFAEDFATRFLAAITEKAEPVVDPNCTCDEHGACAYCWNGKKHDTHPAIEPAPDERLKFALENCRLLAARHRKEDWATLILGFCAEGGVVASPLRDGGSK